DKPASSAAPSTATPASERADLTPENINDAVIRLAGNSQDGIQTAGAFLARLAGRSDHDVMTYMTIPATISGGPSIFQVRMGTGEDKGKNIFILGLIAKIFSLDVEKLTTLIKEKFGGKDESIVNTAIMAFTAGYAYPVGNVLKKHYQFEHVPKPGGRAQITMDGNQAIAYGLIAGGVRYGAGYPITPWSSIMEILRTQLPKYGGIFVQAEDELGAVSLALGFSFSGYLAVTG